MVESLKKNKCYKYLLAGNDYYNDLFVKLFKMNDLIVGDF